MGGSQSTQNETDTTQITLENDDKGEVTITKRRLSQEELTEMKDVLKESEDTFSIDPDLLKAIGKELGYTEEDYDDYEEEDEEEDEYEIHDLVSPIEMPENYPVFPGLSQESLSAIEFKPAPFVDFLDEQEDDKPGTEDPTLPPGDDLNPAEIVSGTDLTEVDPSEDIQVAENTPESVEETVVSEVLSEADVVSSVAEEVLAVDEPSVTDEVLAVDEPSVTEEVIVGEEQSEPEEPVAEYEPSALEVAVTEEVASEEIIAHVEPSEPAEVKTEETPVETLSEEEVPEDGVSPSPIEDQATISDADDLVLVVGEPHVEEEKSGADEPQPVVESVDNVTPEEPCEVCDLEEEVSNEPLLTPAVDPVLVEGVVPVKEAELVEVVSPVDNSVPVDPEVLEEPEEGISADLQQLPEPEIQLEETPSETEVEIPVPDEKFTQEEPISVEIPAVEEEAVIEEEEEPSAPGFVASLFQKALGPFYGKPDEEKELENEKEPEIAVSELVVEPEIAVSEVVAQLEILPPVVEDALEETVEDKDEVQLVEEVPAVTEEVPLVVEEVSPSVEPPKEDVEAKVLSQSENLADSLFGEFKKQEVEKIISEAKLEGARGQAKLDADVMSNAINAERSRWRSRFNVIENNLQKRKHDICDANERGVSIVSSKLSIPESRETCTGTVSEIVECYTKNPTQVLHCQEIAQSFDSCVSKALVSR